MQTSQVPWVGVRIQVYLLLGMVNMLILYLSCTVTFMSGIKIVKKDDSTEIHI